jgi:molybdopterin synthase sulfur carrier subunit
VRVTIVVPRPLRRFSDGESRVEVELAPTDDMTVATVLTALAERYPGVRDRTVDERGELRRHVNVFVDDESVRHAGGIATPVPDGADITILPAVSGGTA